MRRTIISMLAAAALVMVTGQVAMAAVAGSMHDVTTMTTVENFGLCSACHVPHKAAGKRLWPAALTANASYGEVGSMCAYCHMVGATIVPRAEINLPFKNQTLYTHGIMKANIPAGDTSPTWLPYWSATSSATSMECVSCHNVHDPTFEPFLMLDIDTLCANCHQNRQYINAVATTSEGAWGTTRYGYTTTGGNPGSHPVGTDVYSDNSGAGNSPITWTFYGIVAYNGGSATLNHNLGPHVINGSGTIPPVAGSGMGCVTCHVVHGSATDIAGGSTGVTAPFEDCLPFNQQNTAAPLARASGVGQPSNAVCEGCHRGKVQGSTDVYWPNPGATARYTHPVDDYVDIADVGVTAFPTNWPVGAGTGGNAPYIICESCHVAHGNVLAGPNGILPGAFGGSNSHMLRSPETGFCDRCHVGTVTNHHPVNVGLGAASPGTRFNDTAIGNGDTFLTCYDCHNGAGAHNWTAPGAVGLDANWEPTDNARGAADVLCGTGTGVINLSKECIDCHTNAGAHFSPTRLVTGGYAAHSAELQNTSDSSHLIGTFTSAWNVTGPGSFNFLTSTWPLGGWSRCGNTAGAKAFVCESCHDLEVDKNDGTNALLLANYRENLNENRNALCEACHSPQGTATGNAHPQTGDTITKALLNNPTGGAANILQTSTGRYSKAAPDAYANYPAVNVMNCDSCHQTHQAGRGSYTYILEDKPVATTASAVGSPTGNITIYGLNFGVQRYAGTGMQFTVFCSMCHTSGF